MACEEQHLPRQAISRDGGFNGLTLPGVGPLPFQGSDCGGAELLRNPPLRMQGRQSLILSVGVRVMSIVRRGASARRPADAGTDALFRQTDNPFQNNGLCARSRNRRGFVGFVRSVRGPAFFSFRTREFHPVKTGPLAPAQQLVPASLTISESESRATMPAKPTFFDRLSRVQPRTPSRSGSGETAGGSQTAQGHALTAVELIAMARAARKRVAEAA